MPKVEINKKDLNSLLVKKINDKKSRADHSGQRVSGGGLHEEAMERRGVWSRA